MSAVLSSKQVIAQAPVTVTGASALWVNEGDNASAVVDINITAVTGTTPSMTVQLQASPDGVVWYNIGAPSTAQTGVGLLRLSSTMVPESYLRLAYTVTGTTPSFTLTITAFAF